ncbi:MAG: methyltransferase domain-containing protein [Acidobacteria bacterium]|nr:methyltransferase domain-containing protein [Acidobacteriota bacterium]
MPSYQRLREFVRALDLPDEGARNYLEIHLDRIITTLSLAPPSRRTGRALELGTYLHMVPALQCVIGYKEVRGAYYGPLGHSDRKQATINGKIVFQCLVDLFDAEKDQYPYDDGSFDCVLACEIFEHLLHDPMHLLFECRRVLDDNGVLILTTPNVASATAVARALEMSGNPQLYSKYADPRGPYADTEFGHMREYTPPELEEALRCAGFEVECLFTTPAPGYRAQTWVLNLLRELKYPTVLRGEQIYCTARKISQAPLTRYPPFLYEVA